MIPVRMVQTRIHAHRWESSIGLKRQTLSTSMTAREIIGAYATGKATWPDGTAIKVILRPRAESDNEVLTSMFPGMVAALDDARKRSDLPTAATDQDNAEIAERLPGSLIGTTYSQTVIGKARPADDFNRWRGTHNRDVRERNLPLRKGVPCHPPSTAVRRGQKLH
jgi:hypothetical protein